MGATQRRPRYHPSVRVTLSEVENVAENVETNTVEGIDCLYVGFRESYRVYLMKIEAINLQIVGAECSAK